MFSECRTWRYALTCNWNATAGVVAFIGLNPSTADATNNDPTVRRCINYAKSWGFGGMVMLNLFGFRATVPRDMKAARDPVGPGNDKIIAEQCRRAAKVIAAWGVHGAHHDRAEHVTRIVIPHQVWCLGTTKDGHPRHPLYVRADQQLERYDLGAK